MRAHLFALAAAAAGLVALSARADAEDPFPTNELRPLSELPELRPLVELVPFGTPAPTPDLEPAPAPTPSRTPAPTATPTMVSVPAGTAVTLGQYDEYHRPIAAYSIDTDSVRVASYDRCVEAGKCTKPSCGGDSSESRVTCVDAAQANAYCAFVGARLPSEDEWEHAAREARTLGIRSMSEEAEWTGSPYCFFCGRNDQVVRGGPARNPALRGWRAPATRDAGIGFRCAR
jgi:formylglycine-generating enzyme required for sulfatase activity